MAVDVVALATVSTVVADEVSFTFASLLGGRHVCFLARRPGDTAFEGLALKGSPFVLSYLTIIFIILARNAMLIYQV